MGGSKIVITATDGPLRKNMNTTPTRIIRLPEVMERTALKKSTLYALMSKGRFPKNFKIASRAAGWFESEVEEFLQRARP